jgi:hypothetical protein
MPQWHCQQRWFRILQDEVATGEITTTAGLQQGWQRTATTVWLMQQANHHPLDNHDSTACTTYGIFFLPLTVRIGCSAALRTF